MTKPRPRGRPSLGDRARSEIRRIRLTADEDAAAAAAAERAGQTVAEWMHDVVVRAAKRRR